MLKVFLKVFYSLSHLTLDENLELICLAPPETCWPIQVNVSSLQNVNSALSKTVVFSRSISNPNRYIGSQKTTVFANKWHGVTYSLQLENRVVIVHEVSGYSGLCYNLMFNQNICHFFLIQFLVNCSSQVIKRYIVFSQNVHCFIIQSMAHIRYI